MTETRPTMDAASPHPRRSGGVVDYVAAVEQLDAAMVAAPSETPAPAGTTPVAFDTDAPGSTPPGAAPEPSADPELEAAPGGAPTEAVSASAFDTDDTVELVLLSLAEPPAPPVIPPEPNRRLRLALVSGVALALLGGAGIGWALVNGPAGREAAPAQPVVPPSAVPATPGFSTGARLGATGVSDPSAPATGRPSASGGPSAAASGGANRNGIGGTGSNGTGSNGTGSNGTGSNGTGWDGGWDRGGQGDGTEEVGAPGNPQPQGPPPPADPTPGWEPAPYLSATLSRTANVVPLGLSGYHGTIRLDNGGSQAAGDWRVTLTLPGTNPVRNVKNAAVHQDGSTVVFTPDNGATVPAGGSATITFRVHGVLAGEPTSCDVNGVSCATGN